ncbi:hypothetical protein ACFZCV_20865 [Streptomyces sp. NPDC007920]|uniref:hypothetical protein n=1 Tax=Streptomyces sp. NPDC007920 TaxID=3364794 RepID=UPI0036E7C769
MTTEITEQTTPTKPPRTAYQAAAALAAELVDQAQVLPDSVEVHRDYGTDIYGVRLHYGTGLTAGRGVLETASIVDTEITREDVVAGVWVECRTTIDGIPLIARALLDPSDAGQLLTTADTADEPEQTQPAPTADTSPTAVTAPAAITVRPLADVKATAPGTTA